MKEEVQIMKCPDRVGLELGKSLFWILCVQAQEIFSNLTFPHIQEKRTMSQKFGRLIIEDEDEPSSSSKKRTESKKFRRLKIKDDEEEEDDVSAKPKEIPDSIKSSNDEIEESHKIFVEKELSEKIDLVMDCFALDCIHPIQKKEDHATVQKQRTKVGFVA